MSTRCSASAAISQVATCRLKTKFCCVAIIYGWHLHLTGWSPGGATHEEAFTELRAPEHALVPEVLGTLMSHEELWSGKIIKAVSVNVLDITMTLDEDIISREGALLSTNGQEVTLMMTQELNKVVHQTGVVEPIHVVVSPFAS